MSSNAATTAALVRPFTDADYQAWVDVSNRAFPEYRWTVDEVRHGDAGWDHARFYKTRLVSEDQNGRVVGTAEASHQRNRFAPDKYWTDITVDPDARGRGHGSALYAALLEQLAARDAKKLGAGTKESMSDGVAFTAKRGFVEVRRTWESRLDVRTFHDAAFANAPARAAAEGVTITTFTEERERDPEAVRKAFELFEACRFDVPTHDAHTPSTLEQFVHDIVDDPGSLHDGFFIAIRGGRWVGVSNLFVSKEEPDLLWQGLTGVLRDERGKGIAMALKLKTVEYAREKAKHEIRTWNDTANRPMLRINEAMGFVKQPAWLEFEKVL